MDREIRTHRVGSITAGVSMIAFGILFVLHIFSGIISYNIIFKLWPFMIIGLGVEMLLSNVSGRKFIYDKAAIFLLIIITFFAIGMAGLDMMFTHIF